VLLKRVKPYNPYGRMQTEQESDDITKFLSDNIQMDYTVDADASGQQWLAEEIYQKYGNLCKI
jgi:hypothetical protein